MEITSCLLFHLSWKILLRSILTFWLEKLNCGFSHSFGLNFFCWIFLLTSKSQPYKFSTKHRIISYIEPSLIVILNISRTILLFLPEPYDFLALLNTTTGKFFCHSDFGFAAGQDCNLAETLLKLSSKSVTLMTPEPNFVWSL